MSPQSLGNICQSTKRSSKRIKLHMASVESQILPTVKIANDDAPGGFVIINESDLCDHHRVWMNGEAPLTTAPPWDLVLVEGAVGPNSGSGGGSTLPPPYEIEIGAQPSPGYKPVEHAEPLRVAKGPRGKFFVKRGKETLTIGFDNEQDACDQLIELVGERHSREDFENEQSKGDSALRG